ncbi:MAG: 3-methyl-2-oxobutanoate hydroxymethyltransferase, partial [Leptothrix ochracea]
RELHEAGAGMMVLELMPSSVAADVQADNPQLITIGIGAGPATAGQVLVVHDMLGLTRGKLPRFVQNFLAEVAQEGGDVAAALRAYVQAVKDGRFPDPTRHAY